MPCGGCDDLLIRPEFTHIRVCLDKHITCLLCKLGVHVLLGIGDVLTQKITGVFAQRVVLLLVWHVGIKIKNVLGQLEVLLFIWLVQHDVDQVKSCQ